jgi:hypothetical protein
MRGLYARLTLRDWDALGLVLFCIAFFSLVIFLELKSGQADEPHPYVGAAASSLEQRVADLERRVAELENPAVQAVDRKVLEVITMENCGACRVFEADLRQAGKQPIDVRYVKTFPGDPNLRPAFRWRLKNGTYAVQSGYSRGTLPRLVSAVQGEIPKQ